jgi:opacity protein-like surface antigen
MNIVMKRAIVAAIFCLALVQAQAQQKYFYANLDVNTPYSNKSWLGRTSTNGLKLGYRAFINERFSAGVDLGYASFDQYFPKRTFEYPSGALTTDYFNYITSYTLAASGQYNFKLNDLFYPYVGIGLGAANLEYAQYYNIYSEVERSWGFLARPEAGILVRVFKRKSIGLMGAVHYDYMTNKSENNDYSNFSSLGFQVGVMFMDW